MIIKRIQKLIRKRRKNLTVSLFAGLAALSVVYVAYAQVSLAVPEESDDSILVSVEELISESSFASLNSPLISPKRVKVTITAYSSTHDQTDATPFITASNKRVRDGIVAANFLPFGTRIKIPELYGNKVFIVEDRMNRRFNDRLDIWFATRSQAMRFGKRTAEIVILSN